MVSPVRFWLSALSAKCKVVDAGIVHLVERLLAKEKVTGSNPVARSFLSTHAATWPSGKARVCKTLITGSNPVVASEQVQ
jgi:hypothetical protein